MRHKGEKTGHSCGYKILIAMMREGEKPTVSAFSWGLRKSLDSFLLCTKLTTMSHDKHQQFFDLLAEEWDLQFIAEDLERLSRIIDCIEISTGSDIIDLGCGTGTISKQIKINYPRATITCLDLAENMIEMS